MATEMIEGTVDAAEPRRLKRGYALYDALTFHLREGTLRTVPKACAGGDVVAALRRGGEGRFYVSSGGGQTGVHGVRMVDGTSAYSHYNNADKMLLFGAAAGFAMWIVALFGAEVPVTPLVLAPLLLIGFFFVRRIRVAGRRQFDADAAARAAAGAV